MKTILIIGAADEYEVEIAVQESGANETVDECEFDPEETQEDVRIATVNVSPELIIEIKRYRSGTIAYYDINGDEVDVVYI